MLERFADNSIPFYFKKMWFACEQCVSASVYILLEILTIASLQPNDERLELVLKQLPVLGELEFSNNSARVGVRLIRTLLALISGKKEDDHFAVSELENYSRDFKGMPKIYQKNFFLGNDDAPDIQDYLKNNEWLEFFCNEWLDFFS